MKKYFTFFIAFFVFTSALVAQVDYSKKIQSSKNSTESYALFFIDFWATWCGPCAYATIHIDNLQQQFPNNFYAATISEEQPELIKKYLIKHPTRLAVYADFKGKTFNRYNIKALPNGIVLNADGKVVWEGNPADFKASNLSVLLRKHKKKTNIDSIFNYSEPVVEKLSKPDYKPSDDFELTFKPEMSAYNFGLDYKDDYIHIKGTVKSILAYSNQLLDSQIEIDKNLDKVVSVYIKSNLLPFLSQLVLNKLDFIKERKYEPLEALVFNVSKANFWDTNQINWNDNNLKFLIAEDVIEADNVTFKSFAYELSKALKMPFLIKGNYEEEELHDWQLYYQYFQLMQPSLEDDYGVIVTKQITEVEKLIIKKN